MLTAVRFLWNATRGNHLRPWRSDYLKWRIETYSGIKADSLTPRDMAAFVWRQKGELFRFLLWTGRLAEETRRT
jgi:hypothetical protein